MLLPMFLPMLLPMVLFMVLFMFLFIVVEDLLKGCLFFIQNFNQLLFHDYQQFLLIIFWDLMLTRRILSFSQMPTNLIFNILLIKILFLIFILLIIILVYWQLFIDFFIQLDFTFVYCRYFQSFYRLSFIKLYFMLLNYYFNDFI